MKKLICALLILMSLTTTALADEILFRGIPWQSTPLEFVSALVKDCMEREQMLLGKYGKELAIGLVKMERAFHYAEAVR